MKTFVRYITTLAAVLALAGSVPAATVTLKLEPRTSLTVRPGGVVDYQVTATVSAEGNQGLATVGFDIRTDLGVAQQALAAGPAMGKFVPPNGFANPAGFGGDVAVQDIRGIGGAQNTIGNDGVAPNPGSPAGSVDVGLGQTGPVVVALGELIMPAQEGTYTVSLASAFAGVLASPLANGFYPVAEATIELDTPTFTITVAKPVRLIRGSVCVGSYDYIQDAIDNAAAGDVIEMAPGVYCENLVYPQNQAVNFTLQSQAPRNLAMAARTIIDGQQAGPVITCNGSETSAAVIRGITIMNGSAANGGGIWAKGANVSVEDCYIVNNTATSSGGGIHGLYGPVTHCVIAGNTARYGGGLASPRGPLSRCIISANTATTRGGGIDMVYGPLTNCVFTCNNAASQAGAVMAVPLPPGPLPIRNCTFAYNWTTDGNGQGGAFYMTRTHLRNCMLWGNEATAGSQVSLISTITALSKIDYCCVDRGLPDIANYDQNLLTYSAASNKTAQPDMVGYTYGFCVQNATYNTQTRQTTVFCDSSLAAPDHALVGSVLISYSGDSCAIVDNVGTTVTVWGDYAGEFTGTHAPYYDYYAVDLHLNSRDTVCGNAGYGTGIPLDETDIDGQPRVQGSTVDIGADEIAQ